MTIRNSIALSLAVLLCAADDASAIVIDNFDTDQVIIAVLVDGADAVSAAGSGDIIGTSPADQRDVQVAQVGAGFTTFQATGGAASYGQGAGDTGTLVIQWDGNDVPDGSLTPPILLDEVGLGGVDLTDGGSDDRIRFTVNSTDFAANLLLTVYTNATDFSETTIAVPGGIGSSTDFFAIYATDFATGGTALNPATFSNVGAITLVVDDASGTGDLDIVFDLVETASPPTVTIPEPSSLAIWGLLLAVSTAFRGRRRRRLPVA